MTISRINLREMLGHANVPETEWPDWVKILKSQNWVQSDEDPYVFTKEDNDDQPE